MLRFINICLVLGLVALACVIYQVKYQAKGLDAEIKALNGQIDEERDAIAVLRAEWSLLNRPERIERLAQKHLKLAPAKPVQIVTLDKVTDRDFDPARLKQEMPAPAPDAPAAKSTPPEGKPKVSIASAPEGESTQAWPEAKIERSADDGAQ
jgi:cell division protein FtsL